MASPLGPSTSEEIAMMRFIPEELIRALQTAYWSIRLIRLIQQITDEELAESLQHRHDA